MILTSNELNCIITNNRSTILTLLLFSIQLNEEILYFFSFVECLYFLYSNVVRACWEQMALIQELPKFNKILFISILFSTFYLNTVTL